MSHYLHLQVILYNFFEESESERLWRYLMDEDQHKLQDLKHAPLVHEVSSGAIS